MEFLLLSCIKKIGFLICSGNDSMMFRGKSCALRLPVLSDAYLMLFNLLNVMHAALPTCIHTIRGIMAHFMHHVKQIKLFISKYSLSTFYTVFDLVLFYQSIWNF